MQTDPAYREAASQNTKNKDSKKPEVYSVKTFALKDILECKCDLLNPDQVALFKAIEQHYTAAAIRR